MKVSLITITFNSERTLEDTIQSVIAQDYPNIEYIIIDGKSKDGTMAIVDKYRSHISKVVCEPDRGEREYCSFSSYLQRGFFS